MIEVPFVPLSDNRVFKIVSGLWKGARAPFHAAKVLRSTNFRSDGLLDYSDVAELEVEERQFADRQLIVGDIIVERSGGGPKQPVGRVGYFDPPVGGSFCASNFTSTIRIVDQESFRPDFVALYLHYLYLSGVTESLQRATTGIRNLDWSEYLQLSIPRLPLALQETIAIRIDRVRRCYQLEHSQAELIRELKRAAMHVLFTRGSEVVGQKDTEIGPIPNTWSIERLDRCALVISSRMSYSELASITNATSGSVKVLGIKVSDMNSPGNEITVSRAALERELPTQTAERRCSPPGTVVFPKRGAAIATNKKRITSEWTVFDPNVIGVFAADPVDQRFLFQWFQNFDLRTITEPGPTPQLNKKNLEPLFIPLPPDREERSKIVQILDGIDAKLDLHCRRLAVLQELFASLLHKLMSGEISPAKIDSLPSLYSEAPS